MERNQPVHLRQDRPGHRRDPGGVRLRLRWDSAWPAALIPESIRSQRRGRRRSAPMPAGRGLGIRRRNGGTSTGGRTRKPNVSHSRRSRSWRACRHRPTCRTLFLVAISSFPPLIAWTSAVLADSRNAASTSGTRAMVMALSLLYWTGCRMKTAKLVIAAPTSRSWNETGGRASSQVVGSHRGMGRRSHGGT
jgi:hypothetical protein